MPVEGDILGINFSGINIFGESVESGAGEITLLLARWQGGDETVFEQLIPLVYTHLRQVAGAYIRRERNPDLLQPTVLVHELYLKLLDQKKVEYHDRQHFYAFSARVMRRILIDHARGNQAAIHGGGNIRVPLSDNLPWVSIGSEEMLELNRALDELNELDPRKVQLVELRCFLGCTAEETAALTQTSKATVDREMKFIKSWLYRRLHPQSSSIPLQS